MWLAELGEEWAAADRHAACFLGLAGHAHARWTGDEQISWYHRIAESHADLCAALDPGNGGPDRLLLVLLRPSAADP